VLAGDIFFLLMCLFPRFTAEGILLCWEVQRTWKDSWSALTVLS